MSLRWLPNALCVLRMLLSVPTTVFLLRGEYWLTVAVFFVAAVSDALDGYLAKRFNWQTELGKALDPLADKLLLVTTFLTLAYLHQVPLWLAALAVLRDVVITLGAIVYRVLYGPLTDAAPTLISKLNTLMQIAYIGGVVLALASGWPWPWALQLAVWVVAITTIISGGDYVLTYSRRAARINRDKATLGVGHGSDEAP
jgi:cardiolipin synthase (CMP-forming)